MITVTEEAWATTTLRDAQDPGAGTGQWKPLSKLTLERYNLIFALQHTRGYAADGQSAHDAGTVLENSANTLFKVALDGGDLKLTKWSVGNDPEAGIDDAVVILDKDLSDTARPSLELEAGAQTTLRIFYIDEDDDDVHYIESTDSGDTFGAEVNVGIAGMDNVQAIASVSMTKVHCVAYNTGNSRFFLMEWDTDDWYETYSTIYWPHKIGFIDAITIGDRDLIVFYSLGPVHGMYREAGIYGIWEKHGRWSDIFKIDVVGEATDYSYRQHPMISTANDIYFLTLYASEGDGEYNQALRALKTSKDGLNWSQYRSLVICTEAGPAKLLTVDAETDGTWPWSDGLQTYIVGYDKIYGSDSTRLVGEENTDLQVDVTSRMVEWKQSRGVISLLNTLLANHDGGLDDHAIVNADNILLAVREAGYYTGAGAEYAKIVLEQVDFLKEADRDPKRHKQMASRDLMAWMRDRKAKHYEEWMSQVIGYDNYDDDAATGRGGMAHTVAEKGRWETGSNQLWLVSDNQEGVALTTWGSRIMNCQVKTIIRIETTGNDEYAGLVFRASDAGNFWAVYYDETDDKIYLRKKVGNAWDDPVEETAALSWAIDTEYGLMVDARYSYIIVYYSTDGLAWTQAFTHVVSINALSGTLEYGRVGTLGYGYSDQDTDEAAGYEPPAPPPPTVPPGGDGNGEGALFSNGQTVYFVDGTNGRVFRTTNAGASDATAVVYEDLGVVDAGGLNWIALDAFKPDTHAAVCGPNGIWTTANLDSAAPTWTHALDLSGDADDVVQMVVSSQVLEGLWMASGYTDDFNPGQACPTVWWSNDGWATNSVDNDIIGADLGCKGFAKVEVSTHHQDRAWLSYARVGDGVPIIHRTMTRWVTNVRNVWSNYQDVTLGRAPCTHHRYTDNYSDVRALLGAGYTVPAPDEAGVHWDPNEPLVAGNYAGTVTTLDTGEGTAHTLWVGCYRLGQKYWALIEYSAGYQFFVSDDALTWTSQNSFAGMVTQHVADWFFDSDRFYGARDGVAAPLMISIDRGDNWQTQTGNWAVLGYNGDIRCVAPLWTE